MKINIIDLVFWLIIGVINLLTDVSTIDYIATWLMLLIVMLDNVVNS